MKTIKTELHQCLSIRLSSLLCFQYTHFLYRLALFWQFVVENPKFPMMITFQYSVIDRPLLLSTSTLSLTNKTHFRNSEKFLETYVCVRFQVSHNSVPILQHPKLPLARMIHIPRLMMTINLADRSSFSTVTYSCQKMWHCTPNCHLLVWPIYQAQWWKL